MNRTLVFATLMAISEPSAACDRWLVKGNFELRQSNGPVVTGVLEPTNPETISELRGVGSFYSPSLNNQVSGQIEGSITGNQVLLSAQYAGAGSTSCPSTVEKVLDVITGQDLSKCETKSYVERVIYDGLIDDNGNAVGQAWPVPRPNARASWTAIGLARCVDGIPVTPTEIREAMQERPTKQSPGAVRTTDPLASEVTTADKAREPGPVAADHDKWISSKVEERDTAVLKPGEAADQLAQVDIIGSYDTDFGHLLLGAGGGRYAYNGGQLTIQKITGNVVEGTWTETGASTICPGGKRSGPFRFVFNEAGFTGHYGNCGEQPNRKWNGTRR